MKFITTLWFTQFQWFIYALQCQNTPQIEMGQYKNFDAILEVCKLLKILKIIYKKIIII